MKPALSPAWSLALILLALGLVGDEDYRCAVVSQQLAAELAVPYTYTHQKVAPCPDHNPCTH